ncbi:Hypp8003 [Branchiostoma lanceolatum]|uniref:Hypp8003 protein n=1 Tax=Branchiostoma lanceolatum TaxID=7740 RepID=A0A8J9Z6B5_BRALA|nr:Hypp8003 [Branchiostoma lanceolatum]
MVGRQWGVLGASTRAHRSLQQQAGTGYPWSGPRAHHTHPGYVHSPSTGPHSDLINTSQSQPGRTNLSQSVPRTSYTNNQSGRWTIFDLLRVERAERCQSETRRQR